MITIHVHLNDPSHGNLRRCVENEKTGFWRIAEAWLDDADFVCIWSEPGTNQFDQLIVYRASVTGHSTVVWRGEQRRLIHFDGSNADWLDTPDVQPTRPVFDRMGIARETA